VSSGKDPLRYFRVEAREISEELGATVLQLERPEPSAAVMRLLRLAHTLKGAAGIVQQRAIAAHAHALEDALASHRERTDPLAPEDCAAVLAQVDAIAALVSAIEKPEGKAQPQAAGGEAPVIHAETGDIDALLGGIGEAGMRLGALRGLDGLVRQAAQLCRPEEFSKPDTEAALRAMVGSMERELGNGLDLAERDLRQLRGQAEKLRLLSCRTMMTALERAARNAAAACGKQVTVAAEGGEMRLDARVLFLVQRALVQLVRNAVAHGIEPAEVRAALGKPVAGRIALEITRAGGHVTFACRDDGAGVDIAAVRAAARRRGLPTDVIATMQADALLQALFDGGFSTAEAVTEVSGRGVGLDIVREAAGELGGRLRVESRAGQGTRIEITVPAMLSSLPALLVEGAGAAHVLPLAMVRHALSLAGADVAQAPDGMHLVHEEGLLPLAALSALLGDGQAPAAGVILVVAGASGAMALAVDRILATQDIVVRALPAGLNLDPLVCGLAIGADGTPRLVLDADGLLAAARRAAPSIAPAKGKRPPPQPILVIDDSLTTRVLEQSILEAAGYAVEQAVSAEEGLQKARTRRYGLFLVDVEMPGMGGFAFVETIRADPHLRDSPAILITSRDAPEDRQRGLAAGASDYLVKGNFNQNGFLATVRSLLEAA
jgi:two-component system chemotaxis sensor kinase CheA